MKYIKLFMVLVVASVLAVSCSDDDGYNTNDATVGFESTTFTTKESAGIVNIPVKVEGLRNGNVALTVKAEETGVNPAKEDVNYIITDKTLNLNADTLDARTINIEVKMVDDSEINDDRTFKLVITEADGAEIVAGEITVTIRDNDAAFYEKFFGKWILSATEVVDNNGNEAPYQTEITITGETDEENPDYDNILTAQSSAMFNVGVDLDCQWRFRYSFDPSSKQGTLGFICGEQVASYGSAYKWIWATDDGQYLTTDDITAPWALGEDNAFPTTIKFPEDSYLYLYHQGTGIWVILYDLKLTKK